MRHAIYYTPAPDHPLTRAASAWLGRDAFGGEPGARPNVPGFSSDAVEARTEDARRYGFHATLKAPFRLADGRSPDELRAALEQFANRTPPVRLDGLEIANLDGFFALTPAEPSAALDRFAEDVVRRFEPFRARLTPEEIARRKPEKLTVRQRDYLNEFGYPYVLDEFQLHMTLTDRLPSEEHEPMRAALRTIFPATLLAPAVLDRVALFREDVSGAPFTVEASFPLKDAPR